MKEIDRKIVKSLREFYAFCQRHAHSYSLEKLIRQYAPSRKEFNGWQLHPMHSISSERAAVFVVAVAEDGTSLVFCPLLDAVVIYSDLKPVTLKPCLQELADIISSQELYDTINGKPSSGFLANPYKKGVDSILIKMFLEGYFREYFPNSIRR